MSIRGSIVSPKCPARIPVKKMKAVPREIPKKRIFPSMIPTVEMSEITTTACRAECSSRRSLSQSMMCSGFGFDPAKVGQIFRIAAIFASKRSASFRAAARRPAGPGCGARIAGYAANGRGSPSVELPLPFPCAPGPFVLVPLSLALVPLSSVLSSWLLALGGPASGPYSSPSQPRSCSGISTARQSSERKSSRPFSVSA